MTKKFIADKYESLEVPPNLTEADWQLLEEWLKKMVDAGEDDEEE